MIHINHTQAVLEIANLPSLILGQLLSRLSTFSFNDNVCICFSFSIFILLLFAPFGLNKLQVGID
jgi:hypothetical protein